MSTYVEQKEPYTVMSKQQECNFNISYCQYDVKLIFFVVILGAKESKVSAREQPVWFIFFLLQNLKRECCSLGIRTPQEE